MTTMPADPALWRTPEFWISIAALLIAAAALYASNLKRADIRLQIDPTRSPELGSHGWEAWKPTDLRVDAWLFAYNAGARGGLLGSPSVEVDVPGGIGMRAAGVNVEFRKAHVQDSVALEAGDVITAKFTLQLSTSPPAGNTNEGLEEIITSLKKTSTMVVHLRYLVTKGTSIVPWRRGRPVTAHRVLKFDVSTASQAVLCRGRIAELERP